MVLLLGLVSADEGPVVSASATINTYFQLLLSLFILCWIEQKVTNIWLIAHFFLNMVEKCTCQQHHCGASVLCNKFGFFLQTNFDKLHLLLIDLARGLKYFDDVKLR